MATLLLTFLFLLGQDESEYDRLLQRVRDAVHDFMEPEDGQLVSQAQYWDEVLRDIDLVLNFKATREIEAAYFLASGMKNLASGDVRSATDDFKFGIIVNPNQAPVFHFAIGLCYSMTGQSADSEKEFKMASDGAPAWASPKAALAALYMDSGRLDEAEAAVRESIEYTDSKQVKGRQLLLLAQMQDLRGNVMEAETTLRQAMEVDMENPMFPDYLGLLLFRSNKDAALGVWRAAARGLEQGSVLTREISLVEKGLKVGSWNTTFKSKVTSKLGPLNPRMPGGTRYRAFRFESRAGDILKFRTDSKTFQPFSVLLAADGKPVALHDIRSAYFSYLEYEVVKSGTYYLIVSSYLPDQMGNFQVSRSQ